MARVLGPLVLLALLAAAPAAVHGAVQAFSLFAGSSCSSPPDYLEAYKTSSCYTTTCSMNADYSYSGQWCPPTFREAVPRQAGYIGLIIYTDVYTCTESTAAELFAVRTDNSCVYVADLGGYAKYSCSADAVSAALCVDSSCLFGCIDQVSVPVEECMGGVKAFCTNAGETSQPSSKNYMTLNLLSRAATRTPLPTRRRP